MSILIVSGVEGMDDCAAAVAKHFATRVDVADGRRAALGALQRKEFAAVVLDESLAECDPAAAENIWDRAGLAIPLQINFAVSDTPRVIRDIRAAVRRRQREQAVAEKAATVAIESELRNTVTGLLLQSELALGLEGVPHHVTEKLRLVANLAGTLRELLSATNAQGAADDVPTLRH